MIFHGTNIVSETLRKSPNEAVIAWLVRHDAELALPTVTIAEIAFGIQKIQPDRRSERIEQGVSEWRRRFADRIFGLTEEAALAYGDIMGDPARWGARNVSAGWHDRRNCAGQWQSTCHAKPRRFRDHWA
ncbi:hypothetical protein GGE66_005808 [Rhizobium leguminosarum]|uniref:PIN domain-containing protein n=1 Tax=Rhizobium leguminosarum TaxID=384 RepID=A0A7X0DXX4_RHILE|nr:hypothetical protein [Rhizobium leguminosarum]